MLNRTCGCLALAALLLVAGCDLMTSPDERLTRAEALMAAGSYGEAAVEIQNVLSREPKNARAQLALARASLELGTLDAARRALDQAAETGADAVVLADLRAELQLRSGEHARLLEALDAPGNPLPAARRIYLRMRALAGLDRCVEAIEQAYELRATADTDPAASGIVIAECHARHGNTQGALRMLERVTQQSPDSAEGWVALGRLQLLLHRRSAAEESLASATRLEATQLSVPQQLNVHASLAESALVRGDIAAAGRAHGRMVQLASQGMLTALVEAQIELATDNAGDGVAILQALLNRHPDNGLLRPLLAGGLLLAGNREQALQQIGSLAARQPDARKLQLALERARALGEVAPGSVDYWLKVGAVQVLLGQTQLARISLQRAASIDAQAARVLEARARLELTDGNYAEAVRFAEQLAAAQPDEPASLALQGESLAGNRDFARAETVYSKLWAQAPSAAAAVALARVRLELGNANAAEPLRQWLDSHPADHDVRMLLGELELRLGNNRGAIEEFERLLKVNPRNVAVSNNLAWVYHLEKDPRALALARGAWESAPKLVSVADTYGWLLVESGSVAEGTRILTQAYEAGGFTDAEIRYHLAAALARSGGAERARLLLTRLLDEAGEFAGRTRAQQLLDSLET